MKFRRAPAESKISEGKLVALPVKLCEPHPDLQTRLRYDQVDRLAEDIRVHGQLQPGRAVEKPDGTGYLVYLGIGRLLAIKKLFEEDGEPRSYYALLDEGLPFVELFSRSMSENLKRRNLSVLEEVRSFYLASQKASEEEIVAASSKIGEEPAAVKKRIELARVLGDRLERLYDIEAHTGFAFQIGHLESLTGVREAKAFYEAAAAAAYARFSVKEFQSSLRNNSVDKVSSGLPDWFHEIFPEYEKTKEADRSNGSGAAVSLPSDAPTIQQFAMSPSPPPSSNGKPSAVSTTENAVSGSQPPTGIPYKENLPFAECPYCGAMTPFEFKEDSELTVIRFEGPAVPRKDSVAPEGSSRRVSPCVNPKCGKDFWLWVAEVDGEMRAETRRKDEEEEGWFSIPTGKPPVGSVSWDGGRKSWMVNEKKSGRQYAYGEDRKFVGI